MVRIGLVQINNSFSGQNYLPYSIACLQSYAEHRLPPGKFSFLPMIYKRIPVSEIVDRLEGADVIGFSIYVWNARISLEAARRVKRLHPDRLVIFGGPHVPDHAESFLRDNPFIDLVVHNEGEKTFVELLNRLPERDWSGIRGISYIDAAGNFVRAAPVERMRDLEELPSPFLNGIFDDLIASNPEEQWIGLWETNRGCPFQCTFCDWGSATAGKVTKFEFDRLRGELDWFAGREVKYIFVCDANFGIQKRDVEIAEAVAEIRARTGFPHGFSVQNTKNATERAYQTQKILSDAKLNKGVALSMQSLDATTLKNIKRDNISLETYFELARRFTADKVETYSDIILGLPGETYDTFRNGVDKLIRLGQHNRVQFNNLTILPNAEMGNPDYLKKFGMVTVQSEIINIHGTREEMPDDVPEVQDLVIATYSLPPEEWRKTRVFGWMAAFLHFDKLLQLPMMVACELGGLAYRDIIDAFLTAPKEEYPVISSVRELFDREALSMQHGGPEYVYSKEWLGIYWPADEYMFIKLTAEGQLQTFYAEAERLLPGLLAKSMVDQSWPLLEGAVKEAIKLNAALISQPFVLDDLRMSTRYNILEFCDNVRKGAPAALREMPSEVLIERSKSSYSDILDWCREVVWWGNKKGAYLYINRSIMAEPQLAGHY
ncbi:B12-binding domain-containing radical SAM protein [Bradyrhizobium iriomotense]|uniref:B12-binding domain-containing radical SAM protein n=1 Tax=Bradyrhizobium iriomotense TaxID=441950 RepID=UPI001B8A31FA|nr:radical SAM protein [Bradyrhizobium iriomotense]MBR0781112.1 cobalamin-dependent protein [Bradyrhizobium iriomotense]